MIRLEPSGNFPAAPSARDVPESFGIVLKKDDDLFQQAGLDFQDITQTPGGIFGNGTIYTESSKAAHIMRKVMLRMQAWQNYIIPN